MTPLIAACAFKKVSLAEVLAQHVESNTIGEPALLTAVGHDSAAIVEVFARSARSGMKQLQCDPLWGPSYDSLPDRFRVKLRGRPRYVAAMKLAICLNSVSVVELLLDCVRTGDRAEAASARSPVDARDQSSLVEARSAEMVHHVCKLALDRGKPIDCAEALQQLLPHAGPEDGPVIAALQAEVGWAQERAGQAQLQQTQTQVQQLGTQVQNALALAQKTQGQVESLMAKADRAQNYLSAIWEEGGQKVPNKLQQVDTTVQRTQTFVQAADGKLNSLQTLVQTADGKLNSLHADALAAAGQLHNLGESAGWTTEQLQYMEEQIEGVQQRMDERMDRLEGILYDLVRRVASIAPAAGAAYGPPPPMYMPVPVPVPAPYPPPPPPASYQPLPPTQPGGQQHGHRKRKHGGHGFR